MAEQGQTQRVAQQTFLYTHVIKDIAVSDGVALVEIAHVICESRSYDTAEIPIYVVVVCFPTGEFHMFSQGDLFHEKRPGSV